MKTEDEAEGHVTTVNVTLTNDTNSTRVVIGFHGRFRDKVPAGDT